MNKPLPPVCQYFFGLDTDYFDLFHAAMTRIAPRTAHEINCLNVRHRSAIAKDRKPFCCLKPHLKPIPLVRDEFALVVVLVGYRVEQRSRYEFIASIP